MSRILVVEDTQIVREPLSRLLSSEGFAVTTAADGSEAMAALRSGPAARGSGVGDSEKVVSVIVWLCRSHWPDAYGEISPYE